MYGEILTCERPALIRYRSFRYHASHGQFRAIDYRLADTTDNCPYRKSNAGTGTAQLFRKS